VFPSESPIAKPSNMPSRRSNNTRPRGGGAAQRAPADAFGCGEPASFNGNNPLTMGGASLAQSFDELRCFDARLMLKNGILRRMLARAGKVGMAHAFR
jgi:hypothetical protein